jgi:hypothetical protein
MYYYGITSVDNNNNTTVGDSLNETHCHWNWFYPYHYTPFACDVAAFLKKMDVTTLHDIEVYKERVSKPFDPFTQLLAVLPPDSSALLPESYRQLMLIPNSELCPEFYYIDQNGCREEWKAKVLLPFVDEAALICSTIGLPLKEDEVKRNRLNIHSQLFVHSTHPLFTVVSNVVNQQQQQQDISPSEGEEMRFQLLQPSTATADSSHVFINGYVAPASDAPNNLTPNIGKSLTSQEDEVLRVDYIEPPYTGLRTNGLVPGSKPPRSMLIRSGSSNTRSSLYTTRLSNFGSFYVFTIALIYGVILFVEFFRVRHLTTLSDSLHWINKVTISLVFYLCFGLLLTSHRSFQTLSSTSRTVGRGKRKSCLGAPDGAYIDWICEKCYRRNFMRNSLCFQCKMAKSVDCRTMFCHKKIPFNVPRLLIDHRTQLKKCRGRPLPNPNAHNLQPTLT